jgi:hypothetical protein
MRLEKCWSRNCDRMISYEFDRNFSIDRPLFCPTCWESFYYKRDTLKQDPYEITWNAIQPHKES